MRLYQGLIAGRAALLACGLVIAIGGCGGGRGNDAETTEVVAKSQQSASAQWAEAKAKGTDKVKGGSSGSSPSGSQASSYGRSGSR